MGIKTHLLAAFCKDDASLKQGPSCTAHDHRHLMAGCALAQRHKITERGNFKFITTSFRDTFGLFGVQKGSVGDQYLMPGREVFKARTVAD